MNKKINNQLTKILGGQLDEIKVESVLSSNHDIDKAVKIIGAEAKIFTELDKHSYTKDIEYRKIQIEEQKFKHQKDIDETKILNDSKKIELDEERLKIEILKFELEKKKFDIENETRLEENKRKNVDRIINIGVKVAEIGLPIIAYTALAILNFKLIYADDGRSPSELKDLINKVTKR